MQFTVPDGYLTARLLSIYRQIANILVVISGASHDYGDE